MEFFAEWAEDDEERYSGDSDGFDEDSVCSWLSEPESLCNVWRGWKKQNAPSAAANGGAAGQGVLSLIELAAKAVAAHIPYEVERFPQPVPEQLQLRIAYWSFPQHEEDIRLYSCLASGSADEFQKGEMLYKSRAVKDALQIGYHLSATVVPPQGISASPKGVFKVSVLFDRRKITECTCTCNEGEAPTWCQHIVAVCLHRIYQANNVCLRAPVSETLLRLDRDQLQKFAQYLIDELPQQILPTAQKLLDELLSSSDAAINKKNGAPDPTAGPSSASDRAMWYMNDRALRENVRKTMVKFCAPAPMVLSDLNCLSSSAPPAAAEWQLLLRPLRGREPEGIWNLLSIVRELFRRQDTNAIHLLDILTEEMLTCEQLLSWWYGIRVSPAHNSIGLSRCTASANGAAANSSSSSNTAQSSASASLCDEVVTLWRLYALAPTLTMPQRAGLAWQFENWHRLIVDKICKGPKGSNGGGGVVTGGGGIGSAHQLGNAAVRRLPHMELFPGFKPALEATLLTWDDCDVPGVAYLSRSGCGCGAKLACATGQGLQDEADASTSRRKSSPVSGRRPTVSDAGACPCFSDDVAAVQGARARPRTLTLRPAGGGAAAAAAAAVCSAGAVSSSSEGFREQQEAPADVSAQCSSSQLAADRVAAADAGRPAVPQLPSQRLPRVGCDVDAQHDADDDDDDDDDDRGSITGGSSASLAGRDDAAAGIVATSSSPAAAIAALTETKHDESREYYLAGMKNWSDPREVLFARTEALSAHGYTEEACRLASSLALQLLAEAAGLAAAAAAVPVTCTVTHVLPASEDGKGAGVPGGGKRKCATVSLAALHQQQAYAESFAATTLAKAAFLCVTLLEGSPDYHHLAFRIGMFGLEMPRPPAANKALEVKLANQESELAAVLRRVTLGNAELDIVRDRAQQLRDGHIRAGGDAHLPLTLASFIFESLCLPAGTVAAAVVAAVGCGGSRPPSRSAAVSGSASNGGGGGATAAARPVTYRLSGDERLGFEAAVTVLGMKMTVAEAEHPLLCEGARRQRGELAVALLLHYKDDHTKLDVILSRLLDRDIYPHFKTPSISCYLSSSAGSSCRAGAGSAAMGPAGLAARGGGGGSAAESQHSTSDGRPVAGGQLSSAAGSGSDAAAAALDEGFGQFDEDGIGAAAAGQQQQQSGSRSHAAAARGSLRLGPTGRDPRGASSHAHGGAGGDTDGSALDDDDYKELDAKLRCSLYRTNRKHSTGMAAIDSSAPETTSSDNSPTTSRRPWPTVLRSSQQQQQQPLLPAAAAAAAAQVQGACGGAGSDSESSGKSSDSLGSSSSGRHQAAASAAAGAIPVAGPAQAGAVGGGAVGGQMPDQNSGQSPQRSLAAANDSPSLRYVSQYSPFSNDTRSTAVSRMWGRYSKSRSRQQPTVPNQPSEALGHFMFELARLVLSKAGGSSSTSLFTPQQPLNAGSARGAAGAAPDGMAAAAMPPAAAAGGGSGPHRALHLCAFQIGLYSLGVHNCTCPNWLSRTYSSQVSWITGQAMEIGSSAISVLIDMWEGHLTPPEVVVLADKASRGRDPHMAQHAAELALSCLPHAHTLNPSEIQRALQQCKEQGQRMLERACAAVESAANDGGVYPEVLFDVAHKWYELYEESGATGGGCGGGAGAAAHDGGIGDQFAAVVPVAGARAYVAAAMGPRLGPPYHPALVGGMALPQPPPPGALVAQHSAEHMAQAMPSYQFYAPPPSTQAPVFHQPPPAAMPYHPVPYATTLVPCTFQFPPPGYMATGYAYSSAPPLHIMQQHQPPMCGYGGPPQAAYPQSAMGLAGAGSAGMLHAFGQVPPMGMVPPQHALPPSAMAASMQQQQPPTLMGGGGGGAAAAAAHSPLPVAPGNERHAYLVSAYRVGLLAMETLGRRTHDERPQVKYARNPPYREDIKWLLGVAMKLGHGYVQQFCQCAVNSVVSPFVLLDIATDVTHYVLRTHSHMPPHGAVRTPTLNSVVQRCLQMFVQCAHQRINHIQPADYDDFVSIIMSARIAFGSTGAAQFNEMMQSLKRHKSCKKELWQRMVNAVHSMGPLP